MKLFHHDCATEYADKITLIIQNLIIKIREGIFLSYLHIGLKICTFMEGYKTVMANL